MSAHYCGCDPEAQWTCEEHQGVADDVAAWNKWREQGKAADAVDPHAPAPAAQADPARIPIEALNDLWIWASEQRTHLDTDPVPDGLGAKVLAALGDVPAARVDYARDVFDDVIAERDALLQQVSALEKNLADAQSDVAGEIAERERQVATLQGAMAAQDEREQRAGERCGIERGVTGCDWPDAVVEEVLGLRQQIATLTEALEKILNYAADLDGITWLSPVSASEINTRDRWLAGEFRKVAESALAAVHGER